jgi:hypothetical protein
MPQFRTEVDYLKALDGFDAGSALNTPLPEFFFTDPDGAEGPDPRHHDTIHSSSGYT